MKEFIDKLIERLKGREKYYHECALDEIMKNGNTLHSEGYLVKEDAYCDAISIINELAEEYRDAEVLNMAQMTADYNKAKLEELKRISNGGWIPCSERLPNKEEYLKNDGRFIVTDGNRVYQSIYDIYICHCFRTSYSFPSGSSYKTSYEIDNCVIAWMPLPEPYKPKEHPDSITETWKQQTMKRFERVE